MIPIKPRPEQSWLYVLAFDQGTIKVGWTAKPEQRMAAHAEQAAQFGIAVANQWISDPHPIAYELEKSLVRWCASRATGIVRAEWFTGPDFHEVREIANDLVMSGPELEPVFA